MSTSKRGAPDIVLIFELLGGGAGLAMSLWGTDPRKTIDSGDDPVHLSKHQMKEHADKYERKGYTVLENNQTGKNAWESYICVRPGYNVDLGKRIGKQFYTELADTLAKDLRGIKS